MQKTYYSIQEGKTSAICHCKKFLAIHNYKLRWKHTLLIIAACTNEVEIENTMTSKKHKTTISLFNCAWRRQPSKQRSTSTSFQYQLCQFKRQMEVVKYPCIKDTDAYKRNQSTHDIAWYVKYKKATLILNLRRHGCLIISCSILKRPW